MGHITLRISSRTLQDAFKPLRVKAPLPRASVILPLTIVRSFWRKGCGRRAHFAHDIGGFPVGHITLRFSSRTLQDAFMLLRVKTPLTSVIIIQHPAVVGSFWRKGVWGKGPFCKKGLSPAFLHSSSSFSFSSFSSFFSSSPGSPFLIASMRSAKCSSIRAVAPQMW